MQQKEFYQLLKKYKQGLCTAEEEAFIEKWYAEMGHLGQETISPGDNEEIRERAWTNLQEYAATNKKLLQAREKRSFHLKTGTMYAVAATLLLLMAAFVFLFKNGEYHPSDIVMEDNIIFNDTETVREIILEDGSTVFLQPNSQLTYPQSFDDMQRMVSLEGEAFFSVSRDTLRPFLVNTKEVVTKVLGTSFTVSAFRNAKNITVSVKTGKVSVITKESDVDDVISETILTPNQKVVYDRDKHLVMRSLVDEPQPIVRVEEAKRMQFERAPVKEIFEGLEKVYGVDIEFDQSAFASCILTTSIAEGSIRTRLDIICQAINAGYSFEDDRIVISGEGCK